jgi:hypothetical protein
MPQLCTTPGACLALSSAPLLYGGTAGRCSNFLNGVQADDTRAALSGARGVHVSDPGTNANAFLASLFGREPSQTIREDLRRFKQLLEAREIARASATA